MSIRSQVEQYLALRRSLGFKLHGEGRMLLEFADRLDHTGQVTITVAAAVAWASEPSNTTAAHRQRRLGVVRGFARYLAAFDPACQVPPPGLLPARAHRPTPYHYSAEEIAALVHAAGTIAAPLHAATMQALIALIAASGLRVGEALALDRGDVDSQAAVLRVLGKNDQTRLRHTVATEVLRAGATLEEVASLLRHRRHATTVLYAKVDWQRLRELARPWSGSVA
jgi:integrase/recombinase XerD